MKTKKYIIFWLVIIFAAMIAMLLFPAKSVSYQREEKDEQKKESNQISSIHIIEVALAQEKDGMDIWLDRLEEYECRDCGPHYRRVDANGKFSYSCLQFQEATFLEMGRRYDLIEKGTDAVALGIYRCELQKEIARAMFEDQGEGAARHWYTSIYKRGLGLPPGI